MATIAASIKLNDNLSPSMSSMIKTMNLVVSSFENMDKASQNCIDTKSIAAARAEINKASTAFNQFEESIKKADNAQKNHSNSVASAGAGFTGLVGKIGGVIAAYATLQGAQKVLELSDQYTSTTARLDLMNDGLQSTEDLQNRIFKSAQDSRGLYTATADAVSKMGLMAKDAFSSNTETIDFMEQINKQFVMSGTSAQGAEAATLQLTQAMAGGVLRGEELNSIFENAPTIIQSIAKYMNVPIGQIRKMAEAGELTADVVKKAMFSTADETNKRFNAMPKTFNQVWNSFSNVASKSFQGVFNDLSDLANSPQLEGFLTAMAGGISGIAGIVSAVNGVFAMPDVQQLIKDVGANFGIAESNFETAWSAFKTKIETDSPTISANFDGLKTSWDNFYKTITGDCNNFDWGNFGTGMAKLFEYWVQVETGAAGVVLAVGGFVGSIVGFWDALTNIGSGEGPDWVGMIDALNGYIQSVHDGVVSFLSIFTGSERANEIVGEWFKIGGGSGEAYAGGIQQSETIMTTAVQSATDTAIAPMTTLPPTTGLLGQQSGNSFASGLLINQANVGANAQTLADTSKAPLDLLPGFMANQGALGSGNLAYSLTNGAPTVNAAAVGLQDSAVLALNPLPGNLANIGAGAAAGLGSAFQTGLTTLPTDISGVTAGTMTQMDASIQAGTPAVATSAGLTRVAIQQQLDPLGAFGRTTGQLTGDGVIQGLKERESSITAGGDAAASALKTSFKTALGIHSPSTVFRDFGYYAIDGLIEGLSDTELLNFCNDIVADMQAAFKAGNFNLQAGIEFLGSGAEAFFKSIGIGIIAKVGDLLWPTASQDITSGFGTRIHPITGEQSFHEGIDIGAAFGDAVSAAAAGKVIAAGYDGGWGNKVEIDHGNGLTTLYAHLSAIDVAVGQIVAAGQKIGEVGSTGNSTGAHLHYGVYQDGVAVDPMTAKVGSATGDGSAAAGWIQQALSVAGIQASQAEFDHLMQLAFNESTYNPKAYNDSGASGFMQTKPFTFESYKINGYNDIWNPVDNAIAAIRYMLDRYGSIMGTPLDGYASGTNFATRGLHLVGENGPEILSFAGGEKVLDADKSKSLLSSAGNRKSSTGGAKAQIFHISIKNDNTINSELDIKKVSKQLAAELEEEIQLRAAGMY